MPTIYKVTGKYRNGTGDPAKGRVIFTPTAELRHADDGIIVPHKGHEVSLGEDGSFSINLYGTDDAGWLPADWEWRITEQIIDGSSRTYTFALTSDVNLATIDPDGAP